MRPVDVLPADSLFTGEAPNLSDSRTLLAEGDSWFTIGALTGFPPSNLLFELEFARATTIVNCAYPGDTLKHMVEGYAGSHYELLLRDPRHGRWSSGLLLSAGGNDLIDAAQQAPVHKDGTAALPEERLFLTVAEVAALPPGDAGAGRWISEPGWLRLAEYLTGNFEFLVGQRDSGLNAGRPFLLHTYSVPTVWACGVPGIAPRGWLFPALLDYGVPVADRQAVATLLFERLRALIRSFDMDHGSHPLPQVHVFDSAGVVGLQSPDPAAGGPSGDWANEIHPTRQGYRKIGLAMGAWIEQVLARYG